MLREITAEVDGRRYEVKLWVPTSRRCRRTTGRAGTRPAKLRSAMAGTGSGMVTVLMQGTIVKLLVSPGRAGRGGSDCLRPGGDEDGEHDHGREIGHCARCEGVRR